MELGTNFSALTGTTGSGFKKAPCAGYRLGVVSVVDGISKSSGNPMITIGFDIVEGEYKGQFTKFPLRLYLPYATEDQHKRLKGTFELLISNNQPMFPEADPFATGAFDENRLLGCSIGGVLKWDKQYLALNYLTTVEKALAAPVIEQPAATAAPVNGTGGKATGWGI